MTAEGLDSSSRKKKANRFCVAEWKIITLGIISTHSLKREKLIRVVEPRSSSRKGSCVFYSHLYSANDNIRPKIKWKEFLKQIHWICSLCQMEFCKGQLTAFYSKLWNLKILYTTVAHSSHWLQKYIASNKWYFKIILKIYFRSPSDLILCIVCV